MGPLTPVIHIRPSVRFGPSPRRPVRNPNQPRPNVRSACVHISEVVRPNIWAVRRAGISFCVERLGREVSCVAHGLDPWVSHASGVRSPGQARGRRRAGDGTGREVGDLACRPSYNDRTCTAFSPAGLPEGRGEANVYCGKASEAYWAANSALGGMGLITSTRMPVGSVRMKWRWPKASSRMSRTILAPAPLSRA